jgi:dTDP-4-amino-4,6-dideoxygalactose transaminase
MNAKFLDAEITGAITPPVSDTVRHVYHQYTVRVPGDRDAAQRHLAARGVGSAVYYPTPIHRLKPYLGADGRPARASDLPVTEQAVAEVLSLPVHPALTERDLERIAGAVNGLEVA